MGRPVVAAGAPHGSGRVYPNFADPKLSDWAAAYHGANHAALVAAKRRYDPDRFFNFPLAPQPNEGDK